MTDTDKPVTVELLDDEATVTDEFGVHEPIAVALVETILNEKGGRAIALDGGWGSGKSSVVRMMEEKLKKNSKKPVAVSTLDAWSHSGDHLRHVFVKQIWKDLRNAAEANCADQIPRLDELVRNLGFKNGQSPEDSPKPDKGARHLLTLGLLLLLVPLFVALATASLVWPGTWPQRIGIAGLLLPAILVLMRICTYGLANWIERPPPKRMLRKWLSAKSLEKFMARNRVPPQEFLVGLLPQAKPGIPPTTYNVHERSSLDFQDVFFEIIKTILDNPAKWRIVLVVDNLDRLSPDDALEVWKTMRLFMEGPQMKEAWAERLWLVVPYDRASLEVLWGDLEREDKSGNTSPAIRRSKPLSFVDKSFFARFDVPPLMVAKWDIQVKAWLWRLLPNWPEDERRDDADKVVAVLVDGELTNTNRPPSPRELKLFLNDIGCLIRQHNRHFPLPVLAAYVALRRRGKSVEQIRLELQSGTCLSETMLDVLGMESPSLIACLVFGTRDPDRAVELLLGPQLTEYLRSGNAVRLKQIAENPAFAPKAYSLLADAATQIGSNTKRMHLASLAIINSACVEEASDPRVATEMRQFAENAVGRLNDQPPSVSLGECLAYFIKIANKERVTKAAWKINIKLHVSKTDGGGDNSDKIVRYLESLYDETVELEHDECIPDRLEFSGEADLVAMVFAKLGGIEDTSLWERFAWHAESEGQHTAIQPGQGDADWLDYKQTAALVLMRGANSIDWELFAEQLKAALTFDGEVSFEYFSRVWATLEELARVKSGLGDEQRKQLAGEGYLHHHFFKATARNEWPEAAIIFLETCKKVSLRAPARSPLSSTQGHALIQRFLDDPSSESELLSALCALEDNDLRFLLRRFLKESPVCDKAVVAVLRGTEEDSRPKALSARLLYDQWPALRKAVVSDTEGEAMIKGIVGQHAQAGAFSEIIAKHDFDLDRVDLYVAILNTDIEHNSIVLDLAKKGLPLVASSNWTDSIIHQDSLAELLVLVAQQDASFRAGSSLREGLKGVATLAVAGKLPDTLSPKKLHRIVDAGGEQSDVLVGKAVRILLEAPRESQVGNQVWTMFSRDIGRSIIKEPGKMDVERVLLPALISETEEGAILIREVISENKEVLKLASESTLSDFSERIGEHARQSDESERRSVIREVCDLLNIEYEPEKPAAESVADKPEIPVVTTVDQKGKTKSSGDAPST